ncbi:hypothetical protein AB0L47_34470 [Streptomyces bobili]|uniref:hypothetical protein n=1 Tax=Streptomyces bobili TaxID=67280 RepID=UPI0034252D78
MFAKNQWPLAAAVVVVLAVSGCSGAGEETGGGERPGATAGSATGAESAGHVLTVAELRELAFADGEVPNAPISPVRDPVADREKARSFPPVSDPSCQELLDLLEARDSSASVAQIFNWEKDLWGGESLLASYAGDGARRTFTGLRTALKTCKSYTGEGYVGEFTSEVTVQDAPRVGDDALSFRTASPMGDGTVMHREYVVVITGNAVAKFSKLEADRTAQFPRTLIERQVDRLTAAQRA